MYFRRRPGPDEPDVQMAEDVPDNRLVFDTADDPHGALTLRADQRIYLVDFLYQGANLGTPMKLCVSHLRRLSSWLSAAMRSGYGARK
jgi:hypothetical protein